MWNGRRMVDWLILTIGLFLLIWYVKPDDVPVFLHKGALVGVGAMLGFWLDFSLASDLSPERLVDIHAPGEWQIGEAIVLLGAMARRSVLMIGTMAVFAGAI